MPKRRRNPDGSLVVPLSPAQLASLEKGQKALAARHAGAGVVSKEPKPRAKEKRGRGAVEVVQLSKASKPRAKATRATTARPPRPRSKATTPAPAVVAKEGPGVLERAVRWFTST